MRGVIVVVMIGLVLTISGCYSSKSTTVTQPGEQNVAYGKQDRNANTNAVSDIKVDNPALSLADYLRRVPGVMVRGSGDDVTIVVRMGSNYANMSEPLFVLDGVQVGTSYEHAASMVDVNDIKDVTVLKDVSSANMYGYNANNGVVLIETKSGN